LTATRDRQIIPPQLPRWLWLNRPCLCVRPEAYLGLPTAKCVGLCQWAMQGPISCTVVVTQLTSPTSVEPSAAPGSMEADPNAGRADRPGHATAFAAKRDLSFQVQVKELTRRSLVLGAERDGSELLYVAVEDVFEGCCSEHTRRTHHRIRYEVLFRSSGLHLGQCQRRVHRGRACPAATAHAARSSKRSLRLTTFGDIPPASVMA
jgi:hypothetical protein